MAVSSLCVGGLRRSKIQVLFEDDEKGPGGGVGGGTDFLEGNNGKEIHLFD